MTAYNSSFVQLKSPNELIEEPSPSQNGKFFYYDGEELKTSPYENILSQISSGIKGIATSTNTPTAWTVGDSYLYECWRVIEPQTLTNFKDSNSNAIVITATDFENNGELFEVFIDVVNGVATKRLESKPLPQLETEKLNENSTTKAETGKSISNAYPKEYNSHNLFDNSDYVKDKYFSYLDLNYFYNQIATDAVGWWISQPIPIIVGQNYIKKDCTIGFFDSTDKMILAFSSTMENSVTAPSNAVTARITSTNAYLHTAMLVQGDELPSYDSGTKKLSADLIPLEFQNRWQNVVIVAKSGGQFRTINDALDFISDDDANNQYIIFLKTGVYVESVNLCGRYISIVGENKETCIIKNYLNDYYYPPIDMAGNNHLVNLTIWSDGDVNTPANGVNNMPSYGIHFDIASRYEGLGAKVQGRSIVKNCRIIGKYSHAVGQGLWTNQYSEWDDCEFISNAKASFRSHNYLPAGATNQRLFVRNCRFSNPRWNAGTQANPEMTNWVIMLQDSNAAGGDENIDTIFTFQNNIGWCEDDANPQEGLLYTHTPTATGNISGKIKLGKESFGNNIAELNSEKYIVGNIEFTKSEIQTLKNIENLGGVEGKSAYQIAVENGFIGTETQWLESLAVAGEKGEKGDPFTFQDLTPAQILLLKGDDGADGADGQDGTNGKSAFDVWKETNPNGTLQDFYATFGVQRIVKKINNAFTSSVTTPTIVTELSSIALEAGKMYKINLLGTYQTSATTTGGRFHWVLADNAVATTNGFIEASITHIAASSTLRSTINQLDNTVNANSGLVTTGVGAINLPVMFQSQLIISCTVSGTLNFYFGSEVAASSAQINVGTSLIIEEI